MTSGEKAKNSIKVAQNIF